MKKEPVLLFLKIASRKYLFMNNTSTGVKITNKIKINKKKKIFLLPVHINNKVTKNKHLNLLIFNNKKKTITRIEPSDDKRTKIKRKAYKKAVEKAFKGYTFLGFDKKSSFINHNHQCRFAVPAEYMYGNRVTIKKIKNLIKEYKKMK